MCETLRCFTATGLFVRCNIKKQKQPLILTKHCFIYEQNVGKQPSVTEMDEIRRVLTKRYTSNKTTKETEFFKFRFLHICIGALSPLFRVGDRYDHSSTNSCLLATLVVALPHDKLQLAKFYC